MANTRKKTMKKDAGALGGFTIIEVVLVLAIAGLIFLMVFIALPTLQRSQRDTQRRNDLARVSTQLTQYQTNNSGRLPEDGYCDPSGTEVGDIGTTKSTGTNGNSSGTGTNGNSSGTGTNGENNKPSGSTSACNFLRNYMNSSTASEDAESEFVDPTGDPYNLTITTTIPNKLEYDDKRVYIIKKARCNGEAAEPTNGSRDYAIMYKLEGNGTFCQDNGS